MTYIILGLWLSVSLLTIIIANAVNPDGDNDTINLYAFIWPIWLPFVIGYLLLCHFPVELGKYIGKKLREKQKAEAAAKTVKTETATIDEEIMIIENLEEENAKLRAELSGLKNYRGG